jgi:hypothetical protein
VDDKELLPEMYFTNEVKPEPAEKWVGMARGEELAYQLWNILVKEKQWSEEFKEWTWEGKITSLHDAMELSQPYYQSIFNHLVRMGCIQVARRGGAGHSSVVALKRTPDSNLWATGNNPRAAQPKDTTAQAIRDLNKRVTDLEQMAHIHPEET